MSDSVREGRQRGDHPQDPSDPKHFLKYLCGQYRDAWNTISLQGGRDVPGQGSAGRAEALSGRRSKTSFKEDEYNKVAEENTATYQSC